MQAYNYTNAIDLDLSYSLWCSVITGHVSEAPR